MSASAKQHNWPTGEGRNSNKSGCFGPRNFYQFECKYLILVKSEPLETGSNKTLNRRIPDCLPECHPKARAFDHHSRAFYDELRSQRTFCLAPARFSESFLSNQHQSRTGIKPLKLRQQLCDGHRLIGHQEVSTGSVLRGNLQPLFPKQRRCERPHSYRHSGSWLEAEGGERVPWARGDHDSANSCPRLILV